MGRTLMTLSIDEDLARSARDLAEHTDREESEIVEEALRRYLGRQFLQRIWNNDDLPDEDEAMIIAYEELHAMRSELKQVDN